MVTAFNCILSSKVLLFIQFFKGLTLDFTENDYEALQSLQKLRL